MVAINRFPAMWTNKIRKTFAILTKIWYNPALGDDTGVETAACRYNLFFPEY
jgi:hypothetical protein